MIENSSKIDEIIKTQGTSGLVEGVAEQILALFKVITTFVKIFD